MYSKLHNGVIANGKNTNEKNIRSAIRIAFVIATRNNLNQPQTAMDFEWCISKYFSNASLLTENDRRPILYRFPPGNLGIREKLQPRFGAFLYCAFNWPICEIGALIHFRSKPCTHNVYAAV